MIRIRQGKPWFGKVQIVACVDIFNPGDTEKTLRFQCIKFKSLLGTFKIPENGRYRYTAPMSKFRSILDILIAGLGKFLSTQIIRNLDLAEIFIRLYIRLYCHRSFFAVIHRIKIDVSVKLQGPSFNID